MIKSSLYHVTNKNQEPSWNDDPFDLKDKFKGLDNLRSKITVSDLADELVRDYAKYDNREYSLSLHMLPDDEQNKLVQAHMEEYGRDLSECIYGDDFSINNNFTCTLLAMLQNDNAKTRQEFAQTTRNNILIYYTDILNIVLQDACERLIHSEMEDAGYRCSVDDEHGDMVWGAI